MKASLRVVIDSGTIHEHVEIAVSARYFGCDCLGVGRIRFGMANYLVRAKPKPERLGELQHQLQKDSFIRLRPFGKALTRSLKEARTQPDGIAIWEEEDYCSPPLAEERAAVLDKYFDEISVEPVEAGEGWKRIETLPKLNRNG